MKKTNLSNLFFIFFVIIVILSIVIINYHTDKYEMFSNKAPRMYNSEAFIKNDLPYLYIDAYKDVKSENVVIGGSDAELMFVSPLNDNFYHGLYLNHEVLRIKNYYKVLKRYLELHPETKKVLIVINYASFSIINKEIPNYQSNKIKSFIYPLFSLDSCKYSFNILKDKFCSSFKKYKEIEQEDEKDIITWYNPYNIPEYKFNKFVKQKNDEELLYFNKIIDMLKEKNIQYFVLIPPYSSLLLKVLDSSYEFKNEILRIKRSITNKAGIVYDCAYINKYTRQKLFGDHYLYIYGPDHPNYIWGVKLFKVFFDKENADNDFYMILRKDNIEKQLKIQETVLSEYIKETEAEYDIYMNMPEIKKRLIPSWKHVEEYTLDDIPQEYKKEIEYMVNKIRLYNNKQKEENGKF